jgi:hypothetical protein
MGTTRREYVQLADRRAARIGRRGVHRDSICDLVLEDRKVGGACIHRSEALLYKTLTKMTLPSAGA